MTINISQILIVSEPGRLRDSLRVLLKSRFPQAVIEQAETSVTALQLLAANPCTLVMLDAALPDEQAWQALECLDVHRQRCVILAHSFAQQRQAWQAGANAVLLDGFTVESLCAALDAEAQH